MRFLLLITSTIVLISCRNQVQCAAPNQRIGGIPESFIYQAHILEESMHSGSSTGWKDRPQGYVDRDNLTFTIRVIYAPASDTDEIGLLGNELGFSWDKTTPLNRVDTMTWILDVVYKEDDIGATCQDDLSSCSSNILASGDDFIFRAVLTQTTPEGDVETEMLGYNYKIKLPLSQTSPAFDDSEHPSFDVFPWFFNTVGEIAVVDLESQHPEVGRRRVSVYLPPSLQENPQPEYDVTIGFDLSPELMPTFAQGFDYAFAETGSAKESVVIGFGDFDMAAMADRTRLLTPVGGLFYDCKEGTIFGDFCNGCISPDSTAEEFMSLMLFDGCGVVAPLEGHLDLTLDFILEEAKPVVERNIVQPRGSRLTNDRERTMIFGYSLGGLATCYALWTRPETFGRGSCQSSSFWWPLRIDFEAETWGSDYYFLNTTLASNLDNRPQQWILVDVGAAEEDEKMHMMVAAQEVFEKLGDLDVFRPNKNLWLHSYPGELHTYEAWQGRTWSALNVMSIDRHYPQF